LKDLAAMRDEERDEKIFTLELKHQALIPLIEETFEKEHIQFRLRSKYDRAYDGIYIGQKGLSDIYVFKEDKEKALQILKDILAEEF
jgi:hypothetical protein